MRQRQGRLVPGDHPAERWPDDLPGRHRAVRRPCGHRVRVLGLRLLRRGSRASSRDDRARISFGSQYSVAMAMRTLALRLLLLVVAVLGGCHKYNALVEANATCDEKWANIDAELQRRYDLIPNLVATVKASAKYEQDTLDKVVEARASATQIKLTGDDFSDPAKMAAFQKAQDNLGGSLSRLLVVQE